MNIKSFLLVGMLLLSISYFSARENANTGIMDNVKLVPGSHAVVDAEGNLRIDFGTLMVGTKVVLTDAFGIQNENDLEVVINQIQIESNTDGCRLAVLPSENVAVSPGETVWFSVSIEIMNGTSANLSGRIVPVIV
ncbi:MAG: hypothetical protein N3F63_05860 [Thermoplasmata archaeon]|nr:hypothetical protein [Thermoplasmata archaeon]